MSLSLGGPGGGGRGFSYRSAHQQGNDGPNNNRRRQRRPRRQRQRQQQKRRNNRKLQCAAADVFVPENLRGVLIGKRGCTIQRLKKECSKSGNVTIHVPRRGDAQTRCTEDEEDTRPVRVKAETVASLLHVCWRILHVVVAAKRSSSSGDNGQDDAHDDNNEQATTTMTSMACHVRILSDAPSLVGTLRHESPFLSGGTSNMSVYCVESFLDTDEVDTLVDNERFAHGNITAQYETVYQDDDDGDDDHNDSSDKPNSDAVSSAVATGQPSSTLIFVYGTEDQHPERLYRALKEATIQIWQKEQQQHQPEPSTNKGGSSERSNHDTQTTE